MALISLMDQIKAMERRWPDFRVINAGSSCVTWRGELAPLDQRYQVAVTYGVPLLLSPEEKIRETIRGIPESESCRIFPIVRVISPALQLRPNALEEGPLPHVFLDRDFPHLSPLCLFDPVLGEWSRDDLISETTIPWTADWLACYEGWLATGRWRGGGRSVTTALHRV